MQTSNEVAAVVTSEVFTDLRRGYKQLLKIKGRGRKGIYAS